MSKKEIRSTDKRRRTNEQRNELNSLIEWTSQLEIGVNVSVKVNGSQHPTALVVVDLGSPLKQIRLTNDQVSELHHRLRKVGREIMNRDVQIRATADHQNGIHWASLT